MTHPEELPLGCPAPYIHVLDSLKILLGHRPAFLNLTGVPPGSRFTALIALKFYSGTARLFWIWTANIFTALKAPWLFSNFWVQSSQASKLTSFQLNNSAHAHKKLTDVWKKKSVITLPRSDKTNRCQRNKRARESIAKSYLHKTNI